MAKLFTNYFKTDAISKLIANANFFITLGRHTPFVDEMSPPQPENKTVDVYTGVYDYAIVGKSVQAADIKNMIPRVDWTVGNYDAYRHDSANVSYVGTRGGTSYDVFKCLGNTSGAYGTTSSVPPTYQAGADDIYETSDGYRWKYMYSIPNATFTKFATTEYIPVYHDATVRSNATNGSIDYIDVGYPGSNYNTVTGGTIQVASVGGNTYQHVIETTPALWPAASAAGGFYVGASIKITAGPGAGEMRTITDYTVSGSIRTIGIDTPFSTITAASVYEIMPKVVLVGSGAGFVGRALVNTAASNSIYKIDIVSPGLGYVRATATVQGNTGGVANSATITPIIGPERGHGYDPINELGGKYLCFSASFDSTATTANTKSLNVNDFRSISLINAPSFANVYMTLTNSSAVLFTIGEKVTQSNTGAYGTVVARTAGSVTLTNVLGSFLPEPAGNGSEYPLVGASSAATADVVAVYNNGSQSLTANVEYANMTTRVDINTLTGTFNLDDSVSIYTSGNTNTANATVYFANTSQLWLTNVQGTITGGISQRISSSLASANVVTVTPSDIVYGSGTVYAVDNISPINRVTGQTETIKIIIEF